MVVKSNTCYLTDDVRAVFYIRECILLRKNAVIDVVDEKVVVHIF